MISIAIVVPELSGNIELFGVYSICLSITTYLSYADLGFISAGQRFAAEAYKKDDNIIELKIIGFTTFILIITFIPYIIFISYLSMSPESLLTNLSIEHEEVARNLLLIMGWLLPIQIVLERMTNIVLSIRLKDYIAIRVNVCINFLKILSVFFFFYEDRYMLFEYHLFITLCAILGCLINIYIINKILNYNFTSLFKHVRYDRIVFSKIRKLALSSFLLSISFVFYFQSDHVFISKLIGIKEAGIFAIGFTLLTFVKYLTNIIYSPFSHYLNHQAATNEDYHSTIQRILAFSFPIYLIVVNVLWISTEHIIYFWVGKEYDQAVFVTKILFVSMLFQWLNTPASLFYNTALKYKYVILNAIISPIIFVIFVFLSYQAFGIATFAWAKNIIGLIITLLAFHALRSFINLSEIFAQPALPLLICLPAINYFFPIILNVIFPSPDMDTLGLVSLLSLDMLLIVALVFSVTMFIPVRRRYLIDLIRAMSSVGLRKF